MASGERARTAIKHARLWVVEHIEALAFMVALAFGLLFTSQAVIELVR